MASGRAGIFKESCENAVKINPEWPNEMNNHLFPLPIFYNSSGIQDVGSLLFIKKDGRILYALASFLVLCHE